MRFKPGYHSFIAAGLQPVRELLSAESQPDCGPGPLDSVAGFSSVSPAAALSPCAVFRDEEEAPAGV